METRKSSSRIPGIKSKKAMAVRLIFTHLSKANGLLEPRLNNNTPVYAQINMERIKGKYIPQIDDLLFLDV
jgi:hypothetical protein